MQARVTSDAYTRKVHVVTNSGVHPSLGPGFLWEPSQLFVNVGDTVKWTWEPAWDHTAPLHSIVHANTSTPAFASPVSATGTFEHGFTAPGLYLFASEQYASAGMSGSIIVTPSPTHTASVVVATGGTRASFTSPLAGQPGRFQAEAGDTLLGQRRTNRGIYQRSRYHRLCATTAGTCSTTESRPT